MKILLGNTGRGGELCLFTSIIKAYRNACPDAIIDIATGPHYEDLFANNTDINTWHKIPFKDPSRKDLYNNPVVAWKWLANESDADTIEYACEYDFSPCIKNSPAARNSSLYNCYLRITDKRFEFDDIPREVFIYPTQNEKHLADQIADKHHEIILISHVAKSADPVFSYAQFARLGQALSNFGTVCYTGSENDPELPGLIDLRGISYGTLYALSKHIKAFISPDTATPFIVSGMPGKLITLRRDKKFPLSNTGIVLMGYRSVDNTWEMDCSNLSENRIFKKAKIAIGA